MMTNHGAIQGGQREPRLLMDFNVFRRKCEEFLPPLLPETRPLFYSNVQMLYAHYSRFREKKPAMNDPSSTETALLSLLGRARQAALHAYAPYSGFRVGAALRLSNGEIVTGANVENVSYGLTICAERSALFHAVSQFGPEIRVEAVAIANLNSVASPPCGACRQVLAEFIQPDAPIIFPSTGGDRRMTFIELLPLAFEMKLK